MWCPVHGYYYGNTCPGCTQMTSTNPVGSDYNYNLSRIASALERMVEILEYVVHEGRNNG